MEYRLPDLPPINVIGPDDIPWWTERREEPAGRHALVIGDWSTLEDSVVILGQLAEIADILPWLLDELTYRLQKASAQQRDHQRPPPSATRSGHGRPTGPTA
jgi:hypothetical protein